MYSSTVHLSTWAVESKYFLSSAQYLPSIAGHDFFEDRTSKLFLLVFAQSEPVLDTFVHHRPWICFAECVPFYFPSVVIFMGGGAVIFFKDCFGQFSKFRFTRFIRNGSCTI